MPTSGVRLARTLDAEGIGLVNVRSWTKRFTGVLPEATLSSLHPDDLALTWAGSILNPPSARHRVLVAVVGDELVGFAAIAPNQDPDSDQLTGELVALEVDPAQERLGHGSRLLAAAADHAASAGFDMLVAWCPLADEARRGFLQSAGFDPDTAYRDVVVGIDEAGLEAVLREVRLATSLTAPDELGRTDGPGQK